MIIFLNDKRSWGIIFNVWIYEWIRYVVSKWHTFFITIMVEIPFVRRQKTEIEKEEDNEDDDVIEKRLLVGRVYL
jgi:hypothetical protein